GGIVVLSGGLVPRPVPRVNVVLVAGGDLIVCDVGRAIDDIRIRPLSSAAASARSIGPSGTLPVAALPRPIRTVSPSRPLLSAPALPRPIRTVGPSLSLLPAT